MKRMPSWRYNIVRWGPGVGVRTSGVLGEDCRVKNSVLSKRVNFFMLLTVHIVGRIHIYDKEPMQEKSGNRGGTPEKLMTFT